MRKLLVGVLALALSSAVVAQGTNVPKAYERWVVRVLDKLGALEVDCPKLSPPDNAGAGRVCAEVALAPLAFRMLWELYAPGEAQKLSLTLEVGRTWKSLDGGAFNKIYSADTRAIAILYFPQTQYTGLISIYFTAPRP